MPLMDAEASAAASAIPPIAAGADDDSNNGEEDSDDGCRCNVELGIESPLAIELVDDDGETPFNNRALFTSVLEFASTI